MEFKLVHVIFKNIKRKNKEGKEVCVHGYYLKHEGLKDIPVKPCRDEDYALFEFSAEKIFSDAQPKVKDNSGDLLK